MSPKLTAIVAATCLAVSSLSLPASGRPESRNRRASQHAGAGTTRLDLTKIGHISPKGRVQEGDYNRPEVVDELIALGTNCIPYLISKLEDERPVRGDVLDYWVKVSVGDIAFILLIDFFTDSSWEKPTIPGLGWKQFLQVRPNPVLTGEQYLRRFIAKHGRRGIKAKWQRIWLSHKKSLYWDDGERCFKVKKTRRSSPTR